MTDDFPKQPLFGIHFDVLTMEQAVNWVYHQVLQGHGALMKYVVTPNVSLTVRHQDSAAFREYIHAADLTIVDGAPLVAASRWLKSPLPERVAGSDLVLELFNAAIPEVPLRVFLLGAAPGVAERAASQIHSQWQGVRVVGTLSPDIGFETDIEANEAIVTIINATRPDVLIIGLGAPKQEGWAFEHRHKVKVPVALCVGGTIDFLAGEQWRAPRWVRTVGMEWLWRLATSPRRLFRRYFGDALRIPRLLLDELHGQCPQHGAVSSTEIDAAAMAHAEESEQRTRSLNVRANLASQDRTP